jgi:hypothetical protein
MVPSTPTEWTRVLCFRRLAVVDDSSVQRSNAFVRNLISPTRNPASSDLSAFS